jgi:hypothetical protein
MFVPSRQGEVLSGWPVMSFRPEKRVKCGTMSGGRQVLCRDWRQLGPAAEGNRISMGDLCVSVFIS